jgi:uncharacterized protein (DUF427 family)
MGRRRVTPGVGQESVWDYPRPPRVENSSKYVQVVFNGVVIAETGRAVRVLETSHPPTYYIPSGDIKMEHLEPTSRTTWCEWKGQATYYAVSVGDQRVQNAAWCYPEPTPGFEAIQGYVAFYPHLMDACFVDGERVQAQAGGFYGGWITRDIAGPFKGEPRTSGW